MYGSLMAAQVKGAAAQTEDLRLGGDLTLPTTATAENGKVTFATKQLGGMLIATGTI